MVEFLAGRVRVVLSASALPLWQLFVVPCVATHYNNCKASACRARHWLDAWHFACACRLREMGPRRDACARPCNAMCMFIGLFDVAAARGELKHVETNQRGCSAQRPCTHARACAARARVRLLATGLKCKKMNARPGPNENRTHGDLIRRFAVCQKKKTTIKTKSSSTGLMMRQEEQRSSSEC